ncbi:MAG: low temperature requirement protein A [Acidimicrobiales bacterium]
MYHGYGWATNAVTPNPSVLRILLVLAMIGSFLMGLEVPTIVKRGGFVFATAFLAVVVIHFVIFLATPEPGSRSAIIRTVPFNVALGVLILLASFVGSLWSWILWSLRLAAAYLSPILGHIRGFMLEPRHFVERHGFIIIVVLGEDLVAVGVGTRHGPTTPILALSVALGIALTAALWWIYFDGDEVAAERALSVVDGARRQTLAFAAFTTAHLVMIFGAVFTAAGASEAIRQPHETVPLHLLAFGTAIFLVGHSLFRGILRTGPVTSRAAGAVAALVVGLVLPVSGIHELAIMTALVVSVVILDDALIRRQVSETA